MDKKLIVTVEDIEYKSKKSKVKSSLEDIKNNIEMLPKILKYFQIIDISNLDIDGNKFKILFDNDNFIIDNKLITLNSKIDVSSKQVTFDISSLYLKDYEVLLKGKAVINYFDEELKYFGDIFYKNISTKTNIDITKSKLSFFTRSDYFENLHFLKPFLNLDDIANEWMYDNVVGEFKIDWLYGEFDLENQELILKSLQGDAHIKNAKIRFEQNLEEIITNNIKVNYKNDILNFDLISPKYKNKNLDNSFVQIKNLTNEDEGKVLVNIETKTTLDKDILDILKAYDISLPVLQKNGETKAKLFLDIPYSENLPMTTNGEFIVEKSDIFIKDFNFKTNSANVYLDNNQLYVDEASFLYEDMINANVNINLNLDTLKANGNIDINKIFIKNNKDQQILNIKDKTSEITMDFSKKIDIFLVDLKTHIDYDKFIKIDFIDISKIYKYSDILKDNSIKDGNLSIKLEDNNKISLGGTISGFDLPIKKDDKSINTLDIIGNIEDNNVYISSKDDSIKLKIEDEISLYLNGYDIFYDTNNNQNIDISQSLHIYLKDTNLNINNDIYKIKDANIDIQKNLINFEAIMKELNLPIKKDDKEVENLTIIGKYQNGIVDLYADNMNLFLTIKDKKYSLKLDGYDIYFDTKDSEEFSSIEKMNIIGVNSKIVINNENKILADFYEMDVDKNRNFFYLEYEDSKMSFTQNKDKHIDIYIAKANEKFINSLFNRDIMSGGKLDFYANGIIDNLKGKMLIRESNIKNLSILSNIMFFLESSPALINPFLAIPSLFGLNQLGIYQVKDGIVEFEYNHGAKILDIKNLHTSGNGIDFEGEGVVNLSTNQINSKLKLIFMKGYSSIVEYIPLLNYILLGNDNRVETQINISGDLNNPTINTNLLKDGFNAPVNIFKRIFTTPSNLINNFNNKRE
ncbi:AsmA-like C-terminal domain-containing protein [Arcobacter sp. CECT 9188]|uniref:YhdP family protein n=1 Tax=Arcobacter sp. CECT 9188 TaxID=2044505 RepID=UPI002159E714|nr:AsmA-like C-terminal domain-containing protein [Arcobacter sp. CECT 9188]